LTEHLPTVNRKPAQGSLGDESLPPKQWQKALQREGNGKPAEVPPERRPRNNANYAPAAKKQLQPRFHLL